MAGVCDGLQVQNLQQEELDLWPPGEEPCCSAAPGLGVIISRVLGILGAVFFPSGPQVLFHPTQSGSLPFSLDKHLG